MKDRTGLILLIIALLFILGSLGKLPTFILYGGIEVEGEVTNITGTCYTLGIDRCVRQEVNLVNFTKQNLLVCPESYYPTLIQCEKAFKLIEEPKPTISCYYIDEECKVEILELETCPSQYYTNMPECEEALKTPLRHLELLIKNPLVIITLIIGLIGGLILFLKR